MDITETFHHLSIYIYVYEAWFIVRINEGIRQDELSNLDAEVERRAQLLALHSVNVNFRSKLEQLKLALGFFCPILAYSNTGCLMNDRLHLFWNFDLL